MKLFLTSTRPKCLLKVTLFKRSQKNMQIILNWWYTLTAYGLEKLQRMAKATLCTSTGFPFQYNFVMSCQYLGRNSDRSRHWWSFHVFSSESQVSWVEDDEVLGLPPGPWRDVNGLHEAGPAVPILDRVNTKKKVPRSFFCWFTPRMNMDWPIPGVECLTNSEWFC